MESFAVACALSAVAYQERSAWIKELNSDALRGYRRHGTQIELTYEPRAAARVREFVRREQECCPFLGFTIRETSDAFVLEISVPADAGEAADVLFGSYTERPSDR
jgi:hypothetical protein